MERHPTVVYIAGAGHSGSTLLAMLIGSHSAAMTSGELKWLSAGSAERRRMILEYRPCTCGVAPRARCEFWSAVDAEVRALAGVSLVSGLDVAHPDPDRFVEHNRALFDALSRVSERPFVVDSSKSLGRLRRLRRSGAFDIRVVHLMRDPRGVVYSNVRKGRDWRRYALAYAKHVAVTRAALAARPHRALRYERLCADPEGALGGLMAWLGLAYEPTQLDFRHPGHHLLGGNRLGHLGTSVISADVTWKSRLTPVQRASIGALRVLVPPS